MKRRGFLDWKLEFVNAEHQKKYAAEYNQMQYFQHRATLVFGVLQCILPMIVGYILRGRFHYGPYSLLITPAVWALGVIPFFIFFRKRSGLLTGIAMFGSCCASITTHLIVNYDYDFNPLVFVVPFNILLQPVVIRLSIKHFGFSCSLLVLFHILVTSFSNIHTGDSIRKIGEIIPPFYFLCFCLYVGYFFDKRWKYDFLRRQLVNAHATKLKLDVARDASLIRNIFPKNLSDELELQMTKQQLSVEPPLPEQAVVSVRSFKRSNTPVQLFSTLSPDFDSSDSPTLPHPSSHLSLAGASTPRTLRKQNSDLATSPSLTTSLLPSSPSSPSSPSPTPSPLLLASPPPITIPPLITGSLSSHVVNLQHA